MKFDSWWFSIILVDKIFEEDRENFVADFADLVADFVAEKTKPIEYQWVLRV